MIGSLRAFVGKIRLRLYVIMNRDAVKELLTLAKDRQSGDQQAGYWQAIYDAAEVSLGIEEEDDSDRVSALAMKFDEAIRGSRI